MSTTNAPDGKFSNEKNRYSVSIADTNEHDLPDTDGDDGDAGDGYRTGSAETVTATVINNQDQDLTARLEATGARDKGSFSESNTLVDNITVSSGGGVEGLQWSLEDDGSYVELRIVVSFSSTPTGSSDTIVEYRKSYNH